MGIIRFENFVKQTTKLYIFSRINNFRLEFVYKEHKFACLFREGKKNHSPVFSCSWISKVFEEF
jgi:hypothetical protein